MHLRSPAAALLAALALTAACNEPSALGRSRGVASPEPGGLQVRLDVDRAPGPRSVVVTLRVRDDDGGGPGYRVDYGDGSQDEVVLPQGACPMPVPASPQPPYAPHPIDRTVALRHTYDRPGTYAVVVRVESRQPCAGSDETWDGRVDVEVG